MTTKEIEAYIGAVFAMAKTNGMELQPHERVNLLCHALSICGKPEPEHNGKRPDTIPFSGAVGF